RTFARARYMRYLWKSALPSFNSSQPAFPLFGKDIKSTPLLHLNEHKSHDTLMKTGGGVAD
ncbi:hypothetical protein BDDG_09554, partial [Blastomyces dermatitidis ATCC 18188]